MLEPGGIALLAPTGTDLWRYERALEQYGLPFASQAGKGLFRQQEVQDFLALARVLADGRDLVAFGALMRGPLVGLSEEELLDIAAALPAEDGVPPPRFTVTTPLERVVHPVARRTLSILQDLRRRARTTPPALMLEAAAESLFLRPILASREQDDRARAAANIEVLIERARSYEVKGLRAFVRDIGRDWRANAPYTEGRVDADGDAIEIITIHSAKGLEWPVVIPINTGTMLRRREQLVHRTSDNSLHWLIGEVVPPELSVALAAEDVSQARERERLWYVACTRARDVLAIPNLSHANQQTWARVVQLQLADLPVIGVVRAEQPASSSDAVMANDQTRERFEQERAAIAAAAPLVTWKRPSDHDPDRSIVTDAVSADAEGIEPLEIPLAIGAGRIRGLILHKLMEEVLTGEVAETSDALQPRATVLIAQLAAIAAPGEVLPSPDEVTETALRTWQLPDVAVLRPYLQPEVPLYGMAPATTPTAIAARIDALAIKDGNIVAVFDWKSDVAPSAGEMQMYVAQVQDYLELTSAVRGALVYMTLGVVHWVDRTP